MFLTSTQRGFAFNIFCEPHTQVFSVADPLTPPTPLCAQIKERLRAVNKGLSDKLEKQVVAIMNKVKQRSGRRRTQPWHECNMNGGEKQEGMAYRSRNNRKSEGERERERERGMCV